jgi:hypothetical protein
VRSFELVEKPRAKASKRVKTWFTLGDVRIVDGRGRSRFLTRHGKSTVPIATFDEAMIGWLEGAREPRDESDRTFLPTRLVLWSGGKVKRVLCGEKAFIEAWAWVQPRPRFYQVALLSRGAHGMGIYQLFDHRSGKLLGRFTEPRAEAMGQSAPAWVKRLTVGAESIPRP